MNALVSFLRRRSLPAYRPPDGSYRATAAPLGRRVIAGVIDWTIVTVSYLLVEIPLGVFQATGANIGGIVEVILLVLTQVAALAVVGGYFAFFFATGHTLGMRTVDVHVVGAHDGRNPSLARTAARGVLAVVFFLAATTAYTFVLGHYDAPLSTFHQVSRASSIAITCIALFGHLWQVWDRDGRTVWDRLTGLAVIEDMIPASLPDRLWTPWGT